MSDSSRAAAALEEIFLNDFRTLRLHHLELRFLERGILKDGDDSAELVLMALECLKAALEKEDFDTPHGAVARRVAESLGTGKFLEIVFRSVVREVGINSADLDYLGDRVVKRR